MKSFKWLLFYSVLFAVSFAVGYLIESEFGIVKNTESRTLKHEKI